MNQIDLIKAIILAKNLEDLKSLKQLKIYKLILKIMISIKLKRH